MKMNNNPYLTRTQTICIFRVFYVRERKAESITITTVMEVIVIVIHHTESAGTHKLQDTVPMMKFYVWCDM
jgi:hypothetical protein